ncbi:hypothetical protein LPB140_11520 [Sphingorhabdus lutea]|uniref:YdhG-like domain-containing protein n=1 Tax=Sphingorhabdus lutea TaxID=1913578 RepID=A0A1L3JDT2_9SPHN|nr:DUF1801 domain-containing protein [Sphingorhabdus lutea]APG63307.1 hypothetical protein LPB140_11520 [Sphingorhabdus lutea]
MAQAQNKTTPKDNDVAQFIAAIENAQKRKDAETLLHLFTEVTGDKPTMWGDSIIGFGQYHYKYESGREGDFLRTGFSPRKANFSLYLMGGYCHEMTGKKMAQLREKLGKHKIGKSCLYINKLSDIDMDVLRQMILVDKAYMDEKYPR